MIYGLNILQESTNNDLIGLNELSIIQNSMDVANSYISLSEMTIRLESDLKFGILNENKITDMLKAFWEFIKKIAKNIKDFFVKIWNKIKSFFTKDKEKKTEKALKDIKDVSDGNSEKVISELKNEQKNKNSEFKENINPSDLSHKLEEIECSLPSINLPVFRENLDDYRIDTADKLSDSPLEDIIEEILGRSLETNKVSQKDYVERANKYTYGEVQTLKLTSDAVDYLIEAYNLVKEQQEQIKINGDHIISNINIIEKQAAKYVEVSEDMITEEELKRYKKLQLNINAAYTACVIITKFQTNVFMSRVLETDKIIERVKNAGIIPK